MNKQADITFNDKAFFVSGDLCFANVMSVYEKSLSQAKKCADLRFDFNEVHSSDSAGLALIIEWIKFAKAQNKAIKFTHLSDDIMSIAKAAGLDGVFNGQHS